VKHFDVVVIGGGHAGTEAAHAAARTGCQCALITMTLESIGALSCNPAIGGLGKGHLVREIDAMDGLMGRVADAAGIQFRLLNRRKGPAVQGPRAQVDRKLYQEAMRRQIASQQNITVVMGEAVDFIVNGGEVVGVILGDGTEIHARATVLTTGTFLRGVIHVGDVRREGGRVGDRASVPLAKRIEGFGLPMGRLKTGTPPRLDGKTIDWNGLEMQPGDEEPVMFSFQSKGPVVRQTSCGITHTNPRTHEIIRRNLQKSAMYGGMIAGVGPRYCPSIEDKIVRFSDKSSHQIFLEPEGLNVQTVYPNGISTSLPLEVQEAFVRSIAGLENVRILQAGYAIEYDYVDPRALRQTLEVASVPRLFLAGQINGTTGYEEAAGQGLVAGLNAAKRSSDEPGILFSRRDSYIGVMIDDLTTRGVAEPYRMFTSRAEFRLHLRADNADQRLTPLAQRSGCLGSGRLEAFSRKMHRLAADRSLLQSKVFTPREVAASGLKISQDGTRRSALELLGFPDIDFADLVRLSPTLEAVEPESRDQLSREAIYAQYLERQAADVEGLRRDEGHVIPRDFDFLSLAGLSTELKSKLSAVRPETLAQAGRIEGMTPAAMTLILAQLRKRQGRKASA